MQRLAIHKSDIADFDLPPLRIKDTDGRAAKFLAKHGEDCVELDALPPAELRRRITEAVEELQDGELWQRAVEVEKVELASIRDAGAICVGESWQSRSSYESAGQSQTQSYLSLSAVGTVHAKNGNSVNPSSAVPRLTPVLD